ncbi:MAG: hypothetical protein L6Q92_14630 [Phycisphaerae bacterium]|nr:hypothetical protein [Phycisphaerae bacterium]
MRNARTDPTDHTRRNVLALLALVGAAAIAWPFLRPATAWEWRFDGANATVGVTIRGILRHAPDGVYIRAAGRPAGIILDVPKFAAGACAAVEIETAATASCEVPLTFFWQPPGATTYRFTQRPVALASRPTIARFDLTREAMWRGTIGRIGVQWPGVDNEAVIRSVRLVPLPRRERAALAVRQVLARRPLDNTSINYLTGPTVLGSGLNYFLMMFAVVAASLLERSRAVRRRVGPGRSSLAVTFAVWLAADAIVTADIARQVIDDVRVYSATDDPAAVMFGEELARCRELVRATVPPGATYTVLSDDDFYPRHRLDYQLTPVRICVPPEQIDRAAYIVVYHRGAARFDESSGRLWIDDRHSIAGHVNGRRSAEVYVVERTRE